MPQEHPALSELPNLVSFLAQHINEPASQFLHRFENVIFSWVAVGIICLFAYLSSRNMKGIPHRWQNAMEVFVLGVDDFVCGIMGPQGKRYTPFIGTLFIYILCMNLLGLIPFMKSPTSSWSTTLALAICVFVYVQYAALKTLGVGGYFDHLCGKPRGFLALSVVFPLFMFFLHLTTELIRPLTLSLRLRSNVWGDDLLLAQFMGLGITGLPILFFSTMLVIVASVVQALIFSILTAIYFSMTLVREE